MVEKIGNKIAYLLEQLQGAISIYASCSIQQPYQHQKENMNMKLIVKKKTVPQTGDDATSTSPEIRQMRKKHPTDAKKHPIDAYGVFSHRKTTEDTRQPESERTTQIRQQTNPAEQKEQE
jgi:hypothetical protein